MLSSNIDGLTVIKKLILINCWLKEAVLIQTVNLIGNYEKQYRKQYKNIQKQDNQTEENFDEYWIKFFFSS